MEIRSHCVKQEGKLQYLVLDVFFGQKHIAATVVVGEFKDGGIITPVGQEALNRLGKYTEKWKGRFHLVEVLATGRTKSKVSTVAAAVKTGDAVAFMCRDSKIYDEVVAKLNIEARPDEGLPLDN